MNESWWDRWEDEMHFRPQTVREGQGAPGAKTLPALIVVLLGAGLLLAGLAALHGRLAAP